MPLFTIVTVTWNAQDVIQPTLDSVRQQTFTDFEYLIIDGASTDDTLTLVRNAAINRTRIFSEPDKGLYDAMNKAIDRAEGEYIIWLNAGDAFAEPVSLERIAAKTASRPAVVYGQTQIVDTERRVVGSRHLTAPEKLTAQSFSHGMLVCHQAFVARRDIMPHYNLAYRYSADYDWCVNILEASDGDNAYVGDKPIISYLRDGLTTRHHRDSLLERFRIMCRHYGTATAITRHISFVPRYLRRRKKNGSE